MRFKKFFWTLFFFANWGVIGFFWLQESGPLLFVDRGSTAIALGKIAGLTAAYMILLQFFLMGRFPWLERLYGLDRLSRLHQKNGRWGITLLLFHPVLLVYGYSTITGLGIWQQFLEILTREDVNSALISLVLFILVVGTSLYIVRKRLRYESWYFVHLLTYGAVLLSFGHQINIGNTLISSNLFYTYWVALYAVVFLNHALFRFGRPIYLLKKHKFTVSRLERETASTTSIYITGNKIDQFQIHPGQFMIFRFFAHGLWWQAHPFSLSIFPEKNTLRITVKELGNFTKSLPLQLKPGTRVMIDGPYGVFTSIFATTQKIVCMAGGIGITPIRALLEEMLKNGKDVILLYSNKTENDIVFHDELQKLQDTYSTKIIYIVSDSPNFQGEQGRIDQEKITRLVPDIVEREVYVCGPVPMTNSIISVLSSLGIKKSCIHSEKFSF